MNEEGNIELLANIIGAIWIASRPLTGLTILITSPLPFWFSTLQGSRKT